MGKLQNYENRVNDSKLESSDRKYYNDGALKSEIITLNKADGVLKCYFENGALQAEASLKEFKLHGMSVVYYRNGNIHCRLQYLNDKQDGLAQGYYRNGKRAIEILFNKGEATTGVYYKKNGFKQHMSEKQLKRKSKN